MLSCKHGLVPLAAEFSDRILTHPDDIFGALALRVTARALPLIVVPQSVSMALRDEGELFYLDLFRTTLLCCAIQTNITPKIAISIAEKYDNLTKYYSYSMGVVAFRACLRLNLPLPRSEKIEELRRCTQSAYDITANVSMRMGQAVKNDTFWERFEKHLISLETHQPDTQRALESNDSVIARSWTQLSRKLASRNETWKIWIEWFEFRFMGRSGESVPAFLWGEIESRFISNENRFNQNSVTHCNKYFAQCALEVVEEFADFQSNAQQISGGLQFEIGQDNQIRIGNAQNVEPEGYLNSSYSTVVEEVINVIEKMKAECKLNSATYLNESIESYSDSFFEKTWNDPAKVVVRGDALRMLLAAQLNRTAGSDLPELQDRTILVFRNLVRSHNLLVNVYHELAVIDSGLSSNTINRSNDSINGLKRIINYAESKIALDNQAKASIEALIALGSNPDEADRVKIGISISNYAQATFSYIWKHKSTLSTKAATAVGTTFFLAQWALANEKWIIGLFNVNSEVGALIRATLRFLHEMPLL